MKINVKIGSQNITVELNSSIAAKELKKLLPIYAQALIWGEEIYFYIPEKLKYHELYNFVEIGDFTYWPEGPGLCLFFGKTPISSEDKIIPASGVAILGKILNLKEFNFSKVKTKDSITVSET